MCGSVPLPPEAKLSCPGRAFASASNSRSDFAGTDGCTINATGAEGWVELAQTKARVARRVQDDGVTHNVYAEGVGAAAHREQDGGQAEIRVLERRLEAQVGGLQRQVVQPRPLK